MSLEKIFDFIVSAVRKEEKEKWEPLDDPTKKGRFVHVFYTEVKARELIKSCVECGIHHREREKVYTEKLEEAEKKLREEGVSVEVFDNSTGTYANFSNSIGSGSISNSQQQFQPRVDQKMLDSVKNAKNKMIEHRQKAEEYEKRGRAFAFAPDNIIRLTIEDINYYRLQGMEV